MKTIRIAASKHIFALLQKAGSIGKEVKFDVSKVDFSDIDPAQRYYKGLYFEPSTSTALATIGGKSSAADASHCEGKGKQSYGVVAATVVYDVNRSLIPLAFEHYIGSEGGDLWNGHFRNVSEISGFDVEGRVTFVDMEKSIASGFKSSMHNAKLFYDQRHVIKNMDKHLGGSETGRANQLYVKAVLAPSRWRLSVITAQYSAKQSAYLGKFRLPDQSEVDAVMNEAKKLVASGKNLRVPKAIPPTRGRPGNDAGKRKQSFYEKGQGHKKRPHCCGFCGLSDHVRTHCPLRQTEGDDDAM
jgi:hypothetical protein